MCSSYHSGMTENVIALQLEDPNTFSCCSWENSWGLYDLYKIALVFYNHIMDNDTCHHDPPQHSHTPCQSWFSNNCKSSFFHTKGTLNILSCTFLVFSEQPLFMGMRSSDAIDKVYPFEINTIGKITPFSGDVGDCQV